MKARKIVVVGFQASGKSELVRRFTTKGADYQLDRERASTIGAAFSKIPVERQGVTLDVWDTEGNERHSTLIPMYTRGADAILMTYDLTQDADQQIEFLEAVRQNAVGVHCILVFTRAAFAPGQTGIMDSAKKRIIEAGLDFSDKDIFHLSLVNGVSDDYIDTLLVHLATDHKAERLQQLRKAAEIIVPVQPETKQASQTEAQDELGTVYNINQFVTDLRVQLVNGILKNEKRRLEDKYPPKFKAARSDAGRIQAVDDLIVLVNAQLDDIATGRIAVNSQKDIYNALMQPIQNNLHRLDDQQLKKLKTGKDDRNDWKGWGAQLAARCGRAILNFLSVCTLFIAAKIRQKCHFSHTYFAPLKGATYAAGEAAMQIVEQQGQALLAQKR